jgi:hypothetical protein
MAAAAGDFAQNSDNTVRAFIQRSGPSNKNKALLKAAVQAKSGHDERKKEQIPRQQRV